MLRRFCAWDLESLHEFKLIQVNPSQSSSQLHIRFVRPFFSKLSFLCAFSFYACSFSSFSSPFFLFECFSTIFSILFSLPTSTKRTIVVSFLSWKMFFCSEVLLWAHSRVQLEAPSGAKARRRSCPGRFFTGQDVEVILAIFASRPLVDPQFLWFEICVLQWLLVYREDMSGKTCVMLFRFVSLTCYELLGQFFDPLSNIIGKNVSQRI